MKRTFAKWLMICLLLSLLAGCGGKGLSDRRKIEDVSARFSQEYSQYQFVATDVSVDSVERDSKKGTEETWGQVVGETDALVITCPYFAKYAREGGSWKLILIRFGDAEIEINAAPIDEPRLEADMGADVLSGWCNDALSLDSIVIDHRETDYDLLEEAVLFTVNVSEPDASGWLGVEATYALEANGWSLKEWNVVDSGVTEVYGCSVSPETACGDMITAYGAWKDEEIDDCIYVTQNLIGASHYTEFVFEVIQRQGYYSQSKTAYLSYCYTLNNGWSAEGQSPSSSEEYVGTWDVLGQWTYSDSVNDIWVNILDINGNEITYEYRIDCQVPYVSAWYGLSTEHVQIATSGTRTDSFRPVEDEEIALRFPITDSASTCNLYLYPYMGVTFDGRIWNDDNTYILEYENMEKAQAVQAEGSSDWPPESLLLYEDRVVHHETGLFSTTLSFDYGFKDQPDDSDESNHHNVLYYADDDKDGPASNTYNLYGKYHTLTGTIFQEDDAPLGNNPKIRIYGDGNLLYSFDGIAFTEQHYTEDFEIDVTGVRELTVEFADNDYRLYTFIGNMGAPIIALSELTAHIRETTPQEQAAAPAPEEAPAPEPETTPEPEAAPSQTVENGENTVELMLLKSIEEIPDGGVTMTTRILYDDNHEPCQTRYTMSSSESVCDIVYDEGTSSATESSYQETMEGNGDAGSQWFFEDGRVIQRYDFYASGDFQWTNYEYDEAGVLQAVSGSASADKSFVCLFRYDENGDMCEYARDETARGNRIVSQYTVEDRKDSSGNLTERLFWEDGELAICQFYENGYLVEARNVQAECSTVYKYEAVTVNESDVPRWYYHSTLLLP